MPLAAFKARQRGYTPLDPDVVELARLTAVFRPDWYADFDAYLRGEHEATRPMPGDAEMLTLTPVRQTGLATKIRPLWSRQEIFHEKLLAAAGAVYGDAQLINMPDLKSLILATYDNMNTFYLHKIFHTLEVPRC